MHTIYLPRTLVKLFKRFLIYVTDLVKAEERIIKEHMALDFTQLTNDVGATEGVEQSVETLLLGLVGELTTLAGEVENPADQETIAALATRLEVSRTTLSQAITAIPSQFVPTPVATPAAPSTPPATT